MIHREKSRDYCFKLKKVIASVLALTIFGFQSNLIVFATNITGVTGNNNVYNIKPTHWNNAQTGFRQYSNFDLSQGDVANLIFKYGNNDISRFVNLVGNKVNINGVLNSVNGNGQFTAGNVVFISPNGMAVGSSGVVNVGALSVYTPSKLPDINQLTGLSETGLNSAFDSYKNSSNGLITINGHVFTQNGMELYGKGIDGTGNTVSGFKNVDNSVAYSQAGIAGAVDYNTAKANANELFSKLVNTGSTMANSSEFDFSGADGKVVLASTGGINLKSGTNIVNGNVTIENKNSGQFNINGDITANGDVYIYNGKIDNSDFNLTGNLTNLSSSGKTTLINDVKKYSEMNLTGTVKVNSDIDIINRSIHNYYGTDSGSINIANLINDGVNAKTNIINENDLGYGLYIDSIATKGDTYIENKGGLGSLTITKLVNDKEGAKTTILNSHVNGYGLSIESASVKGDTYINSNNNMINIGNLTNSGDGAKTEIYSNGSLGIDINKSIVTNGDTIIENNTKGEIYINSLKNNKAGAKTQITSTNTKYGKAIYKFPNGDFVSQDELSYYLIRHPEYRDLVDIDFHGSPEHRAAIYVKNIDVNGQLDVLNTGNASIQINNLVNNLDGAVTNITNQVSSLYRDDAISVSLARGGLYLLNAEVNGDIKTLNEDSRGTYIGTLKNLKSGALTEIHNISPDDIAIKGITIKDLAANGEVDILNNVYVSSNNIDNGINISKLVNTSSKDNTTIVNSKQDGSVEGKVSINLLDHIETNGDLLIQNLSEGDINLSKEAIIKNNAGKTHIVNAENVLGQMNLLGLINVNNDLWINNKSNDDLIIGGSIINNSNDGLTLITNNGNWLNMKNDTLESQIELGKYNYDTDKTSNLSGGSIKITGDIQTQGETVIANGGNGNIEIDGSITNGIKNGEVVNSNAKTTISNTKNGKDVIISSTGNVLSASDLLIENAGTGSIDIKGTVESKLSNVDINNSIYEIDLVRTQDNTSSHPFLSSGTLEKVNIVRSPKTTTRNGENIKISGTVTAGNDINIENAGTKGVDLSGLLLGNDTTSIIDHANTVSNIGGQIDTKNLLIEKKGNNGVLVSGTVNANGQVDINNRNQGILKVTGTVKNDDINGQTNIVNHLVTNTEDIYIDGTVKSKGQLNIENKGNSFIRLFKYVNGNEKGINIVQSNAGAKAGIAINGVVDSKDNINITNKGAKGTTFGTTVVSSGKTLNILDEGISDINISSTAGVGGNDVNITKTNKGSVLVKSKGIVSAKNDLNIVNKAEAGSIDLAGDVFNLGGKTVIYNDTKAKDINISGNINTKGDTLIKNDGTEGITVTSIGKIENTKNSSSIQIVNSGNSVQGTNIAGKVIGAGDIWINNKDAGNLIISGDLINNSNSSTLITNNGDWINMTSNALENALAKGQTDFESNKTLGHFLGSSITISGNIQTQGETVIANAGDGNINISGVINNGIKDGNVVNNNANTTISNTNKGDSINISGTVKSTGDVLVENAGKGNMDIAGRVESTSGNVDVNNSLYDIDVVRTTTGDSYTGYQDPKEKVTIVRSGVNPTANGKGINISGTVKANNDLSIVNGGTSGITVESTGIIENNNGTTLVRNSEKANEGILIAGSMNLNGDTWIDNKGAKDLTISGNIINGSGTTILSNDARMVDSLDSLNTVQDYLGENINISGNITTNGLTWVANAGTGSINISGNMTNNQGNTEISNTTESQGINISGTVKSTGDILVENAGSGDLVVSNLESTQGNVNVNNNIYTIDIVRTTDNGDESLHKIVGSKTPNNVDSKLNVTGTITANNDVNIFNGGNNGIVTDNGSSIISNAGNIWIDNIGGSDIDLSGSIFNNNIGGSTIISNAVNIVDNLTDLNKKTDYAGSNIKINDTALISTKGKTEIANAGNGSILVNGLVNTSNGGKTNISNTNKGESIIINGAVNSDGSLLIENTGSGSVSIAGNIYSNDDLSIQNQTYSLDIVKNIENGKEVINYVRLDQDSPNLAGGVNIAGNVTSNGDTFIQNAGSQGINITDTSDVIVSNGDLNITNANEGSININGEIYNTTGNVTITNADLGDSINIQGDVVSNGDMLIENAGSGNIILAGNLDSTLGNISIQNQTYSIDTTRNFDSNNEVTLIPVRTYYDIDPSTGGGIEISGDINSGSDLSIANGGKDGITITESSDITTNGDTWIDNKGGSDLVINGDLTNNSNESTIISNSGDRVDNLTDMNKETDYPGENIIIGGDIVTNGDTWIANDGSGDTNISGSIVNNSNTDITITNSNNANDINITGSIIGGGTVLIETGKDGNINGSNLVSGSNVVINEDKYDIEIVRTRDNWEETLHKIVINRPEQPVDPVVPIGPNDPAVVPVNNTLDIEDNDPTRLIEGDRLKKNKFLQLKRESIRYGINGESLALSQASDHIEEIIDISKTGLAVKTDGGLKLSEDVQVSFEYKGIDITATAKVMRVNNHNKTAGLKFTDVDSLTANKILYVSMLRQADIQAEAGKLNPKEVSLTSKLLTQN